MDKRPTQCELAFFLGFSRGQRTSLMITLVLASRSPRRRKLIQLLGYPVHAAAADVDEASIDVADPVLNVMQTAQLKAVATAARRFNLSDEGRSIIVAADTCVAVDGRMLGKPENKPEADRMLRSLRGRTHQVHTGLVLVDTSNGQEISAVHTAIVSMRNYGDDEIDAYIMTGDPMDKAGAYAIQHPYFRPVAHMTGCYTGVMGLSLCHLIQTLKLLNVPVIADMTAIRDSHGPYPCPLYRDLVKSPS